MGPIVTGHSASAAGQPVPPSGVWVRASVNGLVYQSAAPYNITTGRDDNHDLVINDRPLDASGTPIGRNSARGSARWGDLGVRLARGFSFGLSQVNGAARSGDGAAASQAQGGGRGGGGGGRWLSAG